MTETKKVYIVGTDHNFQKGQECYKGAAAEFKQYINEFCRQACVRFLGEEMSREALAEAGVEKSICEMVADDLGLKHCLCDPDMAVRQALGIRQINDIRLEGFHKNWELETIESKILEENRKREEIWLDQIETFCVFPVLFVCGASHVKSFNSLLGSKGLRSEVISMDWAPKIRL